MAESITVRADGSWVFHGEDSTLKNKEDHQVNRLILDPTTGIRSYQMLNKVFCMNCGKDGGLSARTAVYVKYLCDDCFSKGCPEWFIPMQPDEEVAWRMGLPAPGYDANKVAGR